VTEDNDLVRTLIKRQLVFDLVPDDQVQNFLGVLNLTPESPDVAAKELEESWNRLNNASRYLDFIEIYGETIAKIFGDVLSARMETPMTSEELADFISERKDIIVLSATAIISHFLESGLLKHGNLI